MLPNLLANLSPVVWGKSSSFYYASTQSYVLLIFFSLLLLQGHLSHFDIQLIAFRRVWFVILWDEARFVYLPTLSCFADRGTIRIKLVSIKFPASCLSVREIRFRFRCFTRILSRELQNTFVTHFYFFSE